MAFIAINAKADIEGSKKGKLTPAQNAQVNAWTLAKKTGIFNTIGRCVATAKTPVGNVATVEFASGYFVVCGRLVQVEQGSTVDITLPDSGIEKGNIVARFNLVATEDNEFKVFATTQSLTQNDLNTMPTGTYDFSLYKYEASRLGVVLLPRDDSIYIDDVSGMLSNINTRMSNVEDDIQKDIWPRMSELETFEARATSEFGTIWARIEAMGFKSGSISPEISGASLSKIGKYAILKLPRFTPSKTTTYYKLSFTSAQTITIPLARTNNIVENAQLKFTAGSQEIRIDAEGTWEIEATQIGFEIQ